MHTLREIAVDILADWTVINNVGAPATRWNAWKKWAQLPKDSAPIRMAIPLSAHSSAIQSAGVGLLQGKSRRN